MMRSPEGEAGRKKTITALGQQVRQAVAALVPRGSRVALLDFPDYGNVGDSMIWLGQLAALRAAGASVAYAASAAGYDPRSLRRRLRPGKDTILMSGGGNFGDLWPVSAELRKRVLSELADFRVVQMPQSIHFAEERNLDATRTLLGRHPSFTLMVRDERSSALARERLGHPVILCPDAAFALGPVARPAPAEQPIVWLSRDDREGPESRSVPAAGPSRVDWVNEPDGRAPLIERMAVSWTAAGRRLPEHLSMGLLRSRAATRVRHGASMLARGQVVVTNRLHGMILSLLMGIPQFVSDTRQGKISAFHRTWLADALPGVLCETEGEALSRARALAESLVTGANAAG